MVQFSKATPNIGYGGEALLSTGSEMSIMPVRVLQEARKRDIDLYTYVARIPRAEAVVRNA